MKWRIFVNLALGFLLADWLLRYLSAGRLEGLLNAEDAIRRIRKAASVRRVRL